MIDELINSSFEFDFELFKKSSLSEKLDKLVAEYKKKLYKKENDSELEKFISLIIEIFSNLNQLLSNCDNQRIV